MRIYFRLFIFIFLIIELALGDSVTFYEVGATLLIAASNIYREKYNNSIYIVFIEAVIIFLSIELNPYFLVLYGIVAFDLVDKKLYKGILPIIIVGFYSLRQERVVEFLLVIGLCSFFAYASSMLSEKEEAFKKSYDKERRYRYDLETAKAKLINSSMEAAHLAEIKERNRIAREIHDSIGHSVAGILLQLQASYKVHSKDEKKSMELLQDSIDGLSNSLTVLRDTVHNIRPSESVGIEYVEALVKNFSFCETELKHSGDFSRLSANHVGIISSNIKEALTNAAKHSSATKVDISIEVMEKYTRLYIKDNGVGSSNIKEGLGLSGMKERMKNIGGSISISCNNGFLIVCVIPMDSYEGGRIFEGSNS